MDKAVTMERFSKYAVLSITILSCLGCDQSTKMVAQNYLRGHSSISFFDGILNLVYAENTGTVLSIGSGLPESIRFVLFVLFIGIVLLAIIAFVLFKPLCKVNVLALSMVIGGGISNLLDRLLNNGSVIDFMLIKIGWVESGIFNLADIAVFLGACMLCLSFIRAKGNIA